MRIWEAGLGLILASTLMLSNSASGFDAATYYPLSWWSGNKFLEMPEGTQAVAVTALAEGLHLGLSLHDEVSAKRLYTCMELWTAGQAAAVVRKWLDENPGSRHLALSAVFTHAVTAAECAKPQ